jgi:ATP-dependent protease ClpP protease subunit
MTEHCLIFSAEIDQRTTNLLVAYLVELQISGATKLTLAISSPGGGVVPGITNYNILKSMPFNIETHNFGNVDSIANAMFLGGQVRYAAASATFMFHSVGFNGNSAERLEEKNILEKLDIIRADHNRISSLISDRSSLSVKTCHRLFKQQSTKDASWARTNGLIQEVREFTIPQGATVKYLT